MHPTYEDIIGNIERVIEEKGLKQCSVAKRAGMSPQKLSNILNDRREILRIEHLLPMAKSLGVEVTELLKKEDE